MNAVQKHADGILFGTAVFFLVIGFSLYYVKLADVQNLIVIHFVKGRGADVLGSKEDTLKMLFVGTGITVMNAFLAGILRDRNPVIARFAGIFTFLITLLICIAILAIITVN